MPAPVSLTKKAGAQLDDLPAPDRAAALAAIKRLPDHWGRPHLHSGLGIRILRPGVWEFRAGLHLRGLFTWDDGRLWVRQFGTHDELQDYLRNVH